MDNFQLILTGMLIILGVFPTWSVATLEGLFISEEALPWEEAREACLLMNKTLISIHSEAFDRELFETLNGVNLPNNLWTSGREVREGVWIWNSTGEPLFHTRWFVGQPDANDPDELNCFYLAASAQLYWRDATCTADMNFICEDPLPSKNAEQTTENPESNGSVTLILPQLTLILLVLTYLF